MRWGIYVHIPFCPRKCLYCDFPSVPVPGREGLLCRYADALCREIRETGARLREEVPPLPPAATAYLGGGTPTALPAEELLRVLAALRESLPLREDAEITVEANPGTVDGSYLAGLRAAGASRLSLGAQSFSDALLRRLGRIHTARQTEEAVAMAREAGFSNVSLDLMYGLPGQSLETFRESMERAAALGVEHISVYGLQVEEGTAFAAQKRLGKLELPSEEEEDAMYEAMAAELSRHGYRRYEISSFALPGHESRHNLGYWQDAPYLGLGAAAHSYWQGERRANLAEPLAYIEAVERGAPVSRLEERLTRQLAMEEFCFLALRTAEGIPKAAFRAKFRCALEDVYAAPIRRMRERGLLAEDEGHARLTPLGMKYGNQVFAEFLL